MFADERTPAEASEIEIRELASRLFCSLASAGEFFCWVDVRVDFRGGDHPAQKGW
jgi:hypothetical protein